MKKLFLLLLFLSWLLPLQSDSEGDTITRFLDSNVGKRYYISKTIDKKLYIIIYKRFEISFSNDITYVEYPETFQSFISDSLKKLVSRDVTVKIAPHIPNQILDEEIRKNKMKIFMLAGLTGIIALFIGFIIFRTLQLRNEEKHKNTIR